MIGLELGAIKTLTPVLKFGDFFSNYNLQNLISSSSSNATNDILKVFPTVSYGEINVDYNANLTDIQFTT